MPEDTSRSGRKRQAIVEAATALFLDKGYQGTSMDEIASAAAVSKQTVYKHFADKERLFSAMILGTLTAVAEPFATEIRALTETEDVEKDLGELARSYVAAVLQPRVVQLRRLIISEAGRLPALTRAYYERAPERTLRGLADCFEHLAGRGLLKVDEPPVAAEHFAFLILGRLLDKALFYGLPEPFPEAELNRSAEAGVRVFLAAYRPR
ncbi:TetR/AcrR family transcriptional regulator [Amycolatopsis rhizosphaerae]|uniref:TetR/AcrR family transcriptional regulator n=1 Tax=Amycolatopsis rhizosphaerae TaxID=2053003 RepID=UPI001C962C7C|nr:TetR/AcrR family transcriptional regulator [Amycolatopsis rhizosphaerae]